MNDRSDIIFGWLIFIVEANLYDHIEQHREARQQHRLRGVNFAENLFDDFVEALDGISDSDIAASRGELGHEQAVEDGLVGDDGQILRFLSQVCLPS
jgi:hypothetical protein